MNNILVKSFDFSGDTILLAEQFSSQPFFFFLDSSLTNVPQGRYSFIGFDPFEVVCERGNQSLSEVKNKFLVYANRINRKIKALTPFPCGIVGFISYDYGLFTQPIHRRYKQSLNLPDVMFGFYDCVITIDHYEKKIHVTSSGLPAKNKTHQQLRAKRRLKVIVDKLDEVLKLKSNTPLRVDELAALSFDSSMSKENYVSAIGRTLDYIAAGDIYQVNLSQRFEVDLKDKVVDSFEIYKVLRRLSPSSFGSYFHGKDFQIISSSPEQFLQLQNKKVLTRPMKGTRPRSSDLSEDQSLCKELLMSTKDQAELLMITDLERNDLGRVCEYGSVSVKEMRTIEEYSTVFQATSLIGGMLRKDKDGFDLLEACFPGGSITGCPKIRAMQIIEELEPVRRSLYTGSLGFVSFDGDMEFNILIRTLVVFENKIYFQVGGGIVADSNADAEYEETMVKAQAMMMCLQEVIADKS